MGRTSFSTVFLSALATAGTYLIMYFVVGPRLPVTTSEVPSLAGLSVDQARALLDARALVLVLDGERPDDKVPPHTLSRQTPLGGSRIHRGGEVHAFVATPPPPPTVPRLTGMPIADAREALVKARLRAGLVTEAPSDAAERGVVLTSAPPAGGELKVDGVVDLVISSGPSASPVPQVIGKRLSKAKELLEQAGFVAGATRYGSNDDYDQGVVIKQSPAANAAAARGAKIDLVIND
ncbi:MAG: PASTA domain-containing protein [Myxococcales bacterium]|nr:PASTA domain-containing protein [Myxococcales bacterium]